MDGAYEQGTLETCMRCQKEIQILLSPSRGV